MFWYTIAACVIVVVWGALAPQRLSDVTQTVENFISARFGWYYLLLVAGMLAFCAYLFFSRYGNIKLGKQNEKPEHSLISWFTMLFSAGMGMGLVFWTTAETTSHAFKNSPIAKPGSNEAIKDSLRFTFFHWGVHAWAVYAVVALILAYFKFYKGAPGLISATLEPIFGKKSMRGNWGKLIDILAAFATVVGVAATLGFGAAQINSGLKYLFHVPTGFGIQLLIIAISTVIYTASSWSGINKGIKYLSNANMGVAFVLLIMLFIIGPTMYILNMFTDALGSYMSHLVSMSLRLAPGDPKGRGWIDSWTIFYWAWWISWAPFVGIFIARISRGRTIKEFIAGVLLVPSLVCFIFFAVFGASALDIQHKGIEKISSLPVETATFGMLQHFPLGGFMSLLTIIVVATFFITSADSATFVLGMQSTGGSLNPQTYVKISWGVVQAAMAAILLYLGGVAALQNMLIIAALPFSIVIILMMFSFYKEISAETKSNRKLKKAKPVKEHA